jgi:hypothetical protein
MAELSTAPVQTLTEGGYIVTITDEATPAPRRLSVDEVRAGVDLASTALQPGQVTSIVNESSDAYIRVEDHQAALAAQNTVISSLESRLAILEGSVGSTGVVVYEADVFEPGVYI